MGIKTTIRIKVTIYLILLRLMIILYHLLMFIVQLVYLFPMFVSKPFYVKMAMIYTKELKAKP